MSEAVLAAAAVVSAQTAAASQQLEDVKGAAKSWGQTLTSLAGIGGILALVQGETKLRELENRAEVAAGLLLLLAFALAIYAVYQAMVAAHLDAAVPPAPEGFVTADEALNMAAAMALANALGGASKDAGDRLDRSIKTGLAAVALIAVVAVLFWAYPESPAGQKFLLRYDDKTVACGLLAVAQEKPVAEVQPVESC